MGWGIQMGKFSAGLVSEISIMQTEISATEPAHHPIWTLWKFYKGFSDMPRSQKSGQAGQPGSYKEALKRT